MADFLCSGLAWCRARANGHGQAVPLGSIVSDITETKSWNHQRVLQWPVPLTLALTGTADTDRYL